MERTVIQMTMIYSTDYDLKKKYNGVSYEHAKVAFEKAGFENPWFGGNAVVAGIIKDKPFYIIMNKAFETIALAVKDTEVSKLTKDELKAFGIKDIPTPIKGIVQEVETVEEPEEVIADEETEPTLEVPEQVEKIAKVTHPKRKSRGKK